MIVHAFLNYCLEVIQIKFCLTNPLPASVAQLDVPSDWRPGGPGFNPR